MSPENDLGYILVEAHTPKLLIRKNVTDPVSAAPAIRKGFEFGRRRVPRPRIAAYHPQVRKRSQEKG